MPIEPVAGARGELRCLRSSRGDHDVDRCLGERVEARVLDRVVKATVACELTTPEEAHYFDRFLEHLAPNRRSGPALSENVLVQILARPHAQEEAARQHRGRGGRGLRDDRGVEAHRRARDARADDELIRGERDPTEGGPDERALALSVDPGVEVVRDEREREARLLGACRIPDEVEGTVLLARDRISEFHVASSGSAAAGN